jgi:hypothetical protein
MRWLFPSCVTCLGLQVLLLLLELPFSSTLSSSSLLQTVAALPIAKIYSKSAQQVAILDGSEWISVQRVLQEEQKTLTHSKYGYMRVVTGRNKENQRVVAIQAVQAPTTSEGDKSSEDSAQVYEDSIAIIPDKITDQDAIATCIHSLAAIHCTMPRLDGVGGSSSDDVANSFVSGKVVVLGGNDLACFAAHGLAALGVHVSLVSTGSPKVKKPSSSNRGVVDIMKPAVGKSNEGFASSIGRFDALLDTTHDERPAWILNGKRLDMNEEDFGGVMRLLKSRHGCNRYVHPNNSRVFCYP